MLEIEIPEVELFDEEKEEFIELKGRTLVLEHSLISISKWESKWRKPFFEEKSLTREQILDYVLCMCITKNVTISDIQYLSDDNFEAINNYMAEQRTATWFREEKSGRSHEVVTSEVLYYQMFKLGIPIECEKWHISRLLTLIRVFAAKDPSTSQKMSRRDIAAQNRALNEKRKRMHNTKG